MGIKKAQREDDPQLDDSTGKGAGAQQSNNFKSVHQNGKFGKKY